MDLFLLLLRLGLFGVFLVAGLAKLADLAGSRQAMRDFGLSEKLSPVLGTLLPLGELAVAVALLPVVSAWWGALGALALLTLFAAGIGTALLRGQHPNCHCFGQLHSAPAGWPTLLRSLVLALFAGLVVVLGRSTPGLEVFDLLSPLSLTERLLVLFGAGLLVLLLAVGWMLFTLLRHYGGVLLRIEALEARLLQVKGLPVGSPAPGFTLPTLWEETVSLETMLAGGKPVLLLFTDPGCHSCTALLREIGQLAREHEHILVVALISRGSVGANRGSVSASDLRLVLLQQDREVAQAYQVTATPSAVLVRPDGTIGSQVAQGADAIRQLMKEVRSVLVENRLPVKRRGEQAPEFQLPDLSGSLVRLSDLRGSPTLLLFWRPGCGFCQRMLPRLLAWETHPPAGAPRLVVVSSESVESNQAMGLHAPVVLDSGGLSVGGTFGVGGTPTAVLVDAEGRIASELAVGAEAVLALFGDGQESSTHQLS